LCGSRPSLLELTLASFSHHVFRFFNISEVFVNIDLFGGERDRKKCESIVRSHFPEAIIFKPSRNSFGGALQKLWSLPNSHYFLHMEDDWVCHRQITQSEIEQLMGKFCQVTLAKKEIDLSLFTRRNFRPCKNRLFGRINIPNLSRPEFSTSP
jgi:hypothetical protein